MNGYGRLAALVAAAMLVLPAGLSAQGQSCMMQRGTGMMEADTIHGQMGTQAMQPAPRVLLRQREALELSDDQVARLEDLQARIEELRREGLSVLTDEQRSHIRYGMRMMRRDMDPGSGRMKGMTGGRGGMMDGTGMGATGRMSPAGMMQMMAAMHAGMHRQDCPVTPDDSDELAPDEQER